MTDRLYELLDAFLEFVTYRRYPGGHYQAREWQMTQKERAAFYAAIYKPGTYEVRRPWWAFWRKTLVITSQRVR